MSGQLEEEDWSTIRLFCFNLYIYPSAYCFLGIPLGVDDE